MREFKGGGVCLVELILYLIREEILKVGRNFFFKNGISFFGCDEDMDIILYNFFCKEI